jgi:hypothetical protein
MPGNEGVSNPGRRDFIKKIGIGFGSGALAALSSSCGSAIESPAQAKEITLPKEEESDPIKYGEIQEGESLTLAIERVSGRSLNSIGSLQVVWTNNDVDYDFKNKKAFLYQDIAPLPYAQPGDRIVFGPEKPMGDAISEPGILTGQERVILESRTKNSGDNEETYLTVFGGRFDRTVFYKLKGDRSGWEVNYKGNEWTDSDKLKELMTENPTMKSSEAFSRL